MDSTKNTTTKHAITMSRSAAAFVWVKGQCACVELLRPAKANIAQYENMLDHLIFHKRQL